MSNDHPAMNPMVWVAIIGAFQAITLAFLTWIFARVGSVKKAAIETKDQIVNHHPKSPNFRDENDKRHNETRGWFNLLLGKLNRMDKTLDAQGETIDQLLTGFLENRERIEDIEDTVKVERAE